MSKHIRELQERVSRLESQIESHLDRIRALEAERVKVDHLKDLERRLSDAFEVIAQKLSVASWSIFERRGSR